MGTLTYLGAVNEVPDEAVAVLEGLLLDILSHPVLRPAFQNRHRARSWGWC